MSLLSFCNVAEFDWSRTKPTAKGQETGINGSRTALGGHRPPSPPSQGSFPRCCSSPASDAAAAIAALPPSPMASQEQGVTTEEVSSRQSSSTAESPLHGGGGAFEAASRVGAGDASAAYGEGLAPFCEAKRQADQAAVAAPLAGEVVEQRRPAQAAVTATLAGAGRDDPLWGLQGFGSRAAPMRISYFEGGAWRELPPPAVQLLREGFRAGRPVVEVSVGGSPCMFDCARMVLIDVATAAQKPIIWNHPHGRLFHPIKSAAGGDPKRRDQNGGVAAAPAGGTPGLIEEHWDENQVITCPGEVDKLGLRMLYEGDQAYALVEKLFSESMATSAAAARITSIRKCSINLSASGKARCRVFQMWEQLTKAARGTANVRYGWYGDSVAGIAGVVAHGFGQPNHRAVRPEVQAVGVYMAPAYSPLASLSMSVPDHAGERHVLLCRVILGRAEVVDVGGSPRHHPTGADFDSGVDRREKPSWYIVWPTHMNTHILPEFVVSFKTCEPAAAVFDVLPAVPAGIRGGDPGQQRTPAAASSAQLTFEKMFAELGNLMPASRVHAMETLFNHFKAGRITKDVFIKNMAAIGGPKLLALARRFNKR